MDLKTAFSSYMTSGGRGSGSSRHEDPQDGPGRAPSRQAAPPAPRLTCLARLAVVLELHARGAGARVERLPRGQQAQVGAASVVFLALRVDWEAGRGERKFQSRALEAPHPFPNKRHPTCSSPRSPSLSLCSHAILTRHPNPPRQMGCNLPSFSQPPSRPRCGHTPALSPGPDLPQVALISFRAPQRTPPPRRPPSAFSGGISGPAHAVMAGDSRWRAPGAEAHFIFVTCLGPTGSARMLGGHACHWAEPRRADDNAFPEPFHNEYTAPLNKHFRCLTPPMAQWGADPLKRRVPTPRVRRSRLAGGASPLPVTALGMARYPCPGPHGSRRAWGPGPLSQEP